MYRVILFDYDDENEVDEALIAMQRRPRIIYERKNYLELYDNDDFVNRFRLSKQTFHTLLGLIEADISPPSEK